MRLCSALLVAFAIAISTPSWAQDVTGGIGHRTRITLGVDAGPGFPGAKGHTITPLVDVSRARGDMPFAFHAPDESFGETLVRAGSLELGPIGNWQTKRSSKDTNGFLPKVSSTLEAGAFVQGQISPAFRVRGEIRRGLGGHKGTVGTASLDYIRRDGDRWLFSIGPRLAIADGRYQRAYFGIDPLTASRMQISPYGPRAGIEAFGGAASFIVELSPRVGLYSYAKYDRLTGDAGSSPVVRTLGSRHQLAGGLGLTYTFRRRAKK